MRPSIRRFFFFFFFFFLMKFLRSLFAERSFPVLALINQFGVENVLQVVEGRCSIVGVFVTLVRLEKFLSKCLL